MSFKPYCITLRANVTFDLVAVIKPVPLSTSCYVDLTSALCHFVKQSMSNGCVQTVIEMMNQDENAGCFLLLWMSDC